MDGSTRGQTGGGPRVTRDRRADAEQVALSLLVVAGLAVVAFVAAGQAVVDWQYQLAGLADPFLGRPAPGWTAAWYAAASLAYALMVAGVRWAIRRDSPAEPGGVRPSTADGHGDWWRPRWWWPLVALWGGYAAGIGATDAAGGPIDRPGTMRIEFGDPLSTAVVVSATCRTAPGKPTTVVAVSGDGARLPFLEVANQATAEPGRWPTPGAVNLLWLTSAGSGRPVEVPGLPERPAMTAFDTAPGVHIHRPAMTILEPYVFRPTGSEVGGGSGTARFEATRTYMPEWVLNQLVPADPWPASYPLAVTWECDLAAVKPPGPPPPPASEEGIKVRRSAALQAPATIPVEIRIVTGATGATVELDGATIVDADPPLSEGATIARREGSLLSIGQSAAAAGSGTIVGATFRLRLEGLEQGATLGLTIATSGPEPVEVTLYNALGEEAVPVFVHNGVSSDQPGWPITVDADWLVQPVEVTASAPPAPLPSAGPSSIRQPGRPSGAG